MNQTEEILSPEMQEFINMFYQPRLSAYSFFKLFFAALYQSGVREITRDFTNFLFEMKKMPKFNELLREIKFRSNGVFIYSNQVEDGIYSLQNVGLLGKTNPSFGRIMLKFTDEVAQEFLDSCDEPEYRNLTEKIVDKMNEQKNKWGLRYERD
jgi:hypothetical protein